MKRILCFGDSNTWGLIPGTSERFGDNFTGVGMPRLIAVAITAVSYKLRHNTFISIALGTVSYMGLLYLFTNVLFPS